MEQYINNPRYAHLLRYLDPDLPKAEQIALLGIAAGLDQPGQLTRLPGLANGRKREAVLRELQTKGLVARDEHGRLTVCAPDRLLPLRAADSERVLRRTNVQRTLEFLNSDVCLLTVRGFSGIAHALDAEEHQGCAELVRDLERTAAEDRRWNRTMKLGRLASAERRVPRQFLDKRGGSPRSAPSDVLERMQELLLAGIESPEERAQHADAVGELYEEVWPRGEDTLAHLWRIVEAIAERKLDPAARWEEVCRRMAAYLLPRGLPDLLSRFREDPERLQRDSPVPQYGYGWWVDDELDLWSQFWRRYAAALGPGRTKLLWAEAHEQTAQELLRTFPGLQLGPGCELPYRQLFGRVARELSGLSAEVLSALPRRTDAVKRAREDADRDWSAYEERKFLRRVVRYAHDIPPGARPAPREGRRSARDLLTPERVIDFEAEWAPRLLRIELRRRLGRPVTSEEHEHALQAAKDALSAKRRRRRRPRVAEHARRGLTRLEKVRIDAAEGAFPVESVAEEIVAVLDRCAGQADRWQQQPEDAVHAVAEALTRRRLFVVFCADGEVQLSTLAEAAHACGDPVAVHRVWEASGLVGRLGWNVCAELYGLDTVPDATRKAA